MSTAFIISKANAKFSKEKAEVIFLQFQDGSIQLCKVDTRRVSSDAAQDINTLIKLGKGNQRLTFDAFHRLMLEIEVGTGY
jgi:hypothetical protein